MFLYLQFYVPKALVRFTASWALPKRRLPRKVCMPEDTAAATYAGALKLKETLSDDTKVMVPLCGAGLKSS
jgi:hypothetical protein